MGVFDILLYCELAGLPRARPVDLRLRHALVFGVLHTIHRAATITLWVIFGYLAILEVKIRHGLFVNLNHYFNKQVCQLGGSN